jgi:protein TonB
MAYADHSQSSSRTISIVIVALLHAVLGYAFVSGLGIKYVKKAAEQLNVIDVADEPPPPEEPPPPPPPDQPVPPPPVYIPPPKVQFQAPAAPVMPVTVELPRPPAPPPPAPPPPPAQPTPGRPKTQPSTWASTDDYPARALREERAGTTGFTVSYGPDGKPTGCQVTASSGSEDLDAQTCKSVMRNARFVPGVDSAGNKAAGSYSNRIRWVIPR